MSKVHMVGSEMPAIFDGAEQNALCGKIVPNAHAVCEINLETGVIEARSTITFCTTCLQLALTPVGPRRVWLYGVLPAQEVLDHSRFRSQADGEYDAD